MQIPGRGMGPAGITLEVPAESSRGVAVGFRGLAADVLDPYSGHV